MSELMKVIDQNGLIMGFLFVGLIAWLSDIVSKKMLDGKIPGSALAIFAGLILGSCGDVGESWIFSWMLRFGME